MGARATVTPQVLERRMTDTLAAQILGYPYSGPFIGYDAGTDEFIVCRISHAGGQVCEEILGRGDTVLNALTNAKARNPELWRKKK